MRKRQNKFPAVESDSARFMMLYATLALILVTFFLVLLSKANFDESKYVSASGSIQRSFGAVSGGRLAIGFEEGLPDYSLGAGQDGHLVLPDIEMAQIRSVLAPALLNREATIIHIADKRLLSLSADILFKPNSAEIREDIKDILSILADIIAENSVYVAIEGHSGKAKAQVDAWDDSQRRALAVLFFLRQSNPEIKPVQLSTYAYGDGRPLHSNRSPQGQARNNRVDFLFDFSATPVKNTGGGQDSQYNFQGFDFSIKTD